MVQARAQKLASLLFAGFALCSIYAVRAEDVIYMNTAGGTANYGPETHIEKTGSAQRILVYQGTVNINEGAYIKCGGNSGNTCNFIGIDKKNPGAMNINGGTVWCTTSGGGAGVLAVGSSNMGITSTLTLNSGTLKVETQLRSSTAYNSLAGCTSSGTININGGEAEVKQFVFGASSSNSGTSTLNLNGGRLTVEELNFQPYNGQAFTWAYGTLAAARDNIFSVATYAGSKTRTMQITGAPASFDTAGFAQTIPAFTGTGKLRIAGGGAVTFEQSSLTYGLIFDGANINLGALDAGAARLTTSNLEIIGPATLNVTLPESPSGRYPLVACTSSLDGSLGQITVSGGGAGVLIRDGNTLYLSFDADDADAALVYSAAAGGADTPTDASYTRLAFTAAAGAFTVGGDGLAFSQDIADESAEPQAVTAPVTLSTQNSSIYVAEGGRLTLSGGLTATTPRKDGPGTLVLSSATMPATIVPREGVLDFCGNTFNGALTFGSRCYNGEELVLTNGTWIPANATEINFKGSTITFADGFVADFSGKANSRIGVCYAGGGSDASVTTRLVIDGGSLTTADNGGTKGNFVGVDTKGTAILEVRRGIFHAAGGSGRGYLRIAANNVQDMTGIVRVSGGLLQIDRDLSMATMYNGLSAGTGKGVFELSGGTADVGNFYVGATSSSTGRGEVHLSGGILEVGTFKCLAYCTQTVTADGATIRAKGDDTAEAPFMTAAASSDNYAKSYTIGAGGLTVDTAGHAVHCDIPWTGEGGLTVRGEGGSLAVNGTPSFTGDVTVSNGVVVVFDCSHTFAGKLVIGGADAKIRFDTTSYQEDTLTLATGGITLPEGVDNVLDLVELVGEGYMASISDDGKSIVLSLAANVAAFAWWTGAGDPANFSDPANWACTNSAGGVVEGALPVKSTVVVLSGTTAFTVPVGAAPMWASTQIGSGGPVTLGTDCDWAALPNVTIADGSYIDLAGHNLKISNLTAAEGYEGAYVTNSVVGVKPALWAENAFSEVEYIDTEKVTVYTECVEVKSVSGGTFTAPRVNLGGTMDATCVVTGGVMTVNTTGGTENDMVYVGSDNHFASLLLCNDATVQIHMLRIGNVGESSGANVSVSDNATLKLSNFITVGHHNGVECVFTQNGGAVSAVNDFNIGVGNAAPARYEISGGTLTAGRALVPGRNESTGGRGVLVQSGGTVKANTYISIGYGAESEGAYIMSGGTLTFTANRANLAAEGAVKSGLLDISGGEATLAKGLNIGSTGVLRLGGDGRFVTADLSGNASSSVEFNGGTIIANADNAAFFKNIGNVVFKETGVTIDTDGHDIAFSGCVLNATPGKTAINLTGGGSLDFTNTTLKFTGKLNCSFKLAQSESGTFASAPTFAEPVSNARIVLAEDGKAIQIIRAGLVIFVK